jgi:hydrogenase maturation protease
VDAADMGLPPGSIRRFTPEQLAPSHEAPLSLHQMGLSDVLDLARALGHTPDVVIIGVQPASLEPHLGLSVALEAAKDRSVGMVLQELAPCLKAEA